MMIPTGAWVVAEISVGGELVPPLPGSRMTLEVEGNRVAGTAGANRFTGEERDGAFGSLATTMMAGPPELMDQENRYLGHLARIDAAEETETGIQLVSSGVVLVVLEAAEGSSGN